MYGETAVLGSRRSALYEDNKRQSVGGGSERAVAMEPGPPQHYHFRLWVTVFEAKLADRR